MMDLWPAIQLSLSFGFIATLINLIPAVAPGLLFGPEDLPWQKPGGRDRLIAPCHPSGEPGLSAFTPFRQKWAPGGLLFQCGNQYRLYQPGGRHRLRCGFLPLGGQKHPDRCGDDRPASGRGGQFPRSPSARGLFSHHSPTDLAWCPGRSRPGFYPRSGRIWGYHGLCGKHP
jgi:hypothetical protein